MARRLVTRLRDVGARIGIGESTAEKRARAIAQHEAVMQEHANIERRAEQARNRAAIQPVFADATTYPDAARDRVAWSADEFAANTSTS